MMTEALNGRAVALRGAQSIGRSIDILKLLAMHQPGGIHLSSIVEETQLDRTTAYRIVSALVRSGMASRDVQKRYRLGTEAMAIGIASMRRPPLVDRCIPMMKALARQLTAHVLLSVQSGDYSHCLHMETFGTPLPAFASHVGSVRLLGVGMSGLAMLGGFTDQQIRDHYARYQTDYRAHRLNDSRFERLVLQTRKDGYAYMQLRDAVGVGVDFAVGSCGRAGLNVIKLASDLPRTLASDVVGQIREHLERYAP